MSTVRRYLGCGALVVASLAWMTGAAAAQTPSWSLQKSAVPTSPDGAILGVSCAAANACEAVGYSYNHSGQQLTLAESWNGTSWKIQPTLSPGQEINQLDAVSCTSSTACTAVGSYAVGFTATAVLVERWDGTAWSEQSASNVSSNNGLYGVSCRATACMAVGYENNGSGDVYTLAEEWTGGSSWSVLTTQNPPGSTYDVLNSVSCLAATECTAVGSSGTTVDLAEAWNGSTWSLQTTPGAGDLAGVSCLTSTDCTAVGQAQGGGATLAEGWNGTAWTVQSTPSSGNTPYLASVSCTSGGDCMAVGCTSAACSNPVSDGTDATLAEEWNGSSWSIEPSPNPQNDPSSTFTAVACTSSGACEAAGIGQESNGWRTPLGEVWNGSSWAVQKTAAPRVDVSLPQLGGIACPASRTCFAVGSYPDESTTSREVPLVEEWAAGRWVLVGVTPPKGSYVSALSSVSCISVDACTAVGSFDTKRETSGAFAETWNGSKWSEQTIPKDPGAPNSSLGSVSCTSDGDCMAVGAYVKQSVDQLTFAEMWNGSTWTPYKPRNPAGGQFPSLLGVSCTSGSACTAVGYYQNSSRQNVPFAERWNGSSWAIQATPALSSSSYLASVSCTGSQACEAVGTSGSAELAESWNGSAWTVQTVPGAGTLYGVSCPSTSACEAVGRTTGGLTLAETWNGSAWSTQSTPNPPPNPESGQSSAYLVGVSCFSASACSAAGSSYYDAVHVFVERYA